jgi:hypothetical protein
MKHSHHTSGHEAPPKARPKSDPAAAVSAQPEGDMEVQIREAAYYRYLARGAEVGHALEDWLQAESELLENGKAATANH